MFELSEEQKLTEQNVHELAKKGLFPKPSCWDDHEEFLWERLRKMTEIGPTGLRLPSVYGGADADLITRWRIEGFDGNIRNTDF